MGGRPYMRRKEVDWKIRRRANVPYLPMQKVMGHVPRLGCPLYKVPEYHKLLSAS